MSTRRLIGSLVVLLTLGATTATQSGCGGGSADSSPTGEYKPVMAPDYKGGSIADEGPGAGTAAKTKSKGALSEEGPGAGTTARTK